MTTNRETKLNNDDKTDSASASSKESSRSRGSSVSSRNNENCQRKDGDEETKPSTKRRKTSCPPSRQQLYFLRDNDKPSTMTEKSSEDYGVKRTLSDHSNKRKYKTKLNYSTKNSSDSYFKDTYRMSMHDATVRHRKVRTKWSPPKNENATMYKPKSNRTVAAHAQYEHISSTDEATWDFPEVIINKQRVDEGMQTLFEKTRQFDVKMRPNPQNMAYSTLLDSHPQTHSVAFSLFTNTFQALVKKLNVTKPTKPKPQLMLCHGVPQYKRLTHQQCWQSGPKNLWQSRLFWPNQPVLTKHDAINDSKIKKYCVFFVAPTSPSQHNLDELITNYSNWLKLLRVCARTIYFKNLFLRLLNKGEMLCKKPFIIKCNVLLLQFIISCHV